MQVIKLQLKTSYGQDRYYAYCDISDTIISLMGCKCIDIYKVKTLEKVFIVEIN